MSRVCSMAVQVSDKVIREAYSVSIATRCIFYRRFNFFRSSIRKNETSCNVKIPVAIILLTIPTLTGIGYSLWQCSKKNDSLGDCYSSFNSLVRETINDAELLTRSSYRFSRTLFTAIRIAIDYQLLNWTRSPTSEYYDDFLHIVHENSAIRLMSLFRRQGGIYIKAGQHMSSLSYLLPYEYWTTMIALQQEAPESSFEDVKRTILEELGSSIDELFAFFEEIPLGSASLAQVHRAILSSGEEVAVKVQHSHIADTAFLDLYTIELLVKIIHRIYPNFNYQWLVNEFKLNLPKELDFVQEASNAEKLRTLFSNDAYLIIPKVYWKYTSRKVLTMEYINGRKVTDLDYINEHRLSPAKIISELTRIFCKMIFVHGYVHCDPHPGNVWIRSTTGRSSNDFEIVLLDHGLYMNMDIPLRVNYAQFWTSILKNDKRKMESYAIKLGSGHTYQLLVSMLTAREWESVQCKLHDRISHEEIKNIQNSLGDLFVDMNRILSSVPREILMLFKTNDLLRNISESLHTFGVRPLAITMQYCLKAIHCYDEDYQRKWFKTLRDWLESLSVDVGFRVLGLYLWISNLQKKR